MRHTIRIFASFVLLLSIVGASSDKLPPYHPAKLQKSSLSSIGSDSMNELMNAWVARYRTLQPELEIQVTGKGSATAPAALVDGSAHIGPMARPMKSPEVHEFAAKYGFEPTKVRTALVGMAVYVSQDNPLTSVGFAQLDRMYSESRRFGGGSPLTTWNELGVSGPLAGSKIVPVGLLEDSPLNAYFRQQVLLQGTFQSSVSAASDTRAVVETVAANKAAIGYGVVLRELPAGVKMLAVKKNVDSEPITPTLSNLVTERYPLSRFLNVYVVRSPGRNLDLGVQDFLKFVLSEEGQKVVEAQEMIPLPGSIARQELVKIE